jgi:isoleucyl-tRNA synthetase
MSIHLGRYPNVDYFKPDQDLIKKMAIVRSVCNNALSIRKDNSLRVRIPLSNLYIYSKNLDLGDKYLDIIKDEINVKNVYITDKTEKITPSLKINFKECSGKIGSKMQDVIKAVKSGEYEIHEDHVIVLDFKLEKNEYDLSMICQEPKSMRYCNIFNFAIYLDTIVDDELKAEGIARDFIRSIQQERKNMELNISDYIEIKFYSKSDELKNAIKNHNELIKSQTLARTIESSDNIGSSAITSDEMEYSISIKKL